MEFSRLRDLVQDRLASLGFELCVGFEVKAYNEAVPPDYALPTLGRQSPVGLLIGNHRSLWEPFIRAYRGNESLRSSSDPLEQYTEESVREALREVLVGSEVRFGHRTTPSPVALQQLAQVAGLAELTPAHLSVHPLYGPWIAFRAAVVFELDGHIETEELDGVCDETSIRDCEEAFAEAIKITDGRGHEAIRETWKAWLAVRDACGVGRRYRYSEAQIGYHYTHQRHFLEED